MAAQPQFTNFLRLEDMAAIPEKSIQTYLQFKGQKLEDSLNNLVNTIILYHNDGYLITLDSRVVQHKDFSWAMRLTPEDLIARVDLRGAKVNTLMTNYDLIRMLLLSKDDLSDELRTAASKGETEKLAKILLLGTNLFTVEDYNEVMTLAGAGNYKGIVEMMLARGANSYNLTMLTAAAGGHEGIVKMMLARGATYYNVAMANAAIRGHKRIVKMMLEIMAAKQIKPDYNRAMRAAATGGHKEIVEMMLARGANNYNETMNRAGIDGYTKIVEMMLVRGANNYNETMNSAAAQGHKDIVIIMLAQGANNYNEAITSATLRGHKEIADLISNYQATGKLY